MYSRTPKHLNRLNEWLNSKLEERRKIFARSTIEFAVTFFNIYPNRLVYNIS
jgi:hypothetical protein